MLCARCAAERERRYERWCMAVERSLGWELLPHKQPKPGKLAHKLAASTSRKQTNAEQAQPPPDTETDTEETT